MASMCHLLPINGLIIIHPTGSIYSDDKTKLYYPESESSWKITPINRATFEGNDITLGYSLSATLYFTQNKFKELGIIERLHNISTEIGEKLYHQIILVIGNNKIAPAEELPENINSTSGAFVYLGDEPGINFSIENIEFRPRLKIELRAFISNPAIVNKGEGFYSL